MKFKEVIAQLPSLSLSLSLSSESSYFPNQNTACIFADALDGELGRTQSTEQGATDPALPNRLGPLGRRAIDICKKQHLCMMGMLLWHLDVLVGPLPRRPMQECVHKRHFDPIRDGLVGTALSYQGPECNTASQPQ